MAYGLLDVSQVGEAEYPLIGVLHELIFGRPGALEALREPWPDLLTLIAHLEGNPVGFLVGHGQSDKRTFVIAQMGVLAEYAGQGLEERMLGWAEEHARSRRYTRVESSADPGGRKESPGS